MGIDWTYLEGVAIESDEWGEHQLEKLYQALVGITKLRSRDKTPEKLEMLFTLTQAVMMAKYTQVSALEEEVGRLAEDAGRGEARREAQLQEEITRLRARLEGEDKDSEIAYDWSSAWRVKRREMEEAIHQKNMEIQQFMDDLHACESERASLRTSVAELEERLSQATQEINTITAEYLQIKNAHSHTQENMGKMQREMQGLQSRVEELLHDKARLQQDYQDLSEGVEARVDQLKVVVSQREEEAQRLRSQMQQLTSGMHTQTADLARVAQLQQDVKERDEEITRLSQQLTEASQEMDSSAALIISLRNSRSQPEKEGAGVIKQLRGELNESQKMMQLMRTQLLAAEEDAQMHAQDLSTVMGELQSYLAGEYSLADAVRELKEVRVQVRERDAQISKLTALSNSLHININELLDENAELREQLKLEPRPDLDLPGVKKTHWQDTKKVIEELTGQVNKLQDEKVTLRTKIYELMRELSNTKGSLQLTTLSRPFDSESSQLQTQNLEDQISQLSMAVGQLIKGKAASDSNRHPQQQLELSEIESLKEKCFRLEGEKSSMERLLHSNLFKKKKRKLDIDKGEEEDRERIEEGYEGGSGSSPASQPWCPPSPTSPTSPTRHDPRAVKVKVTSSPTAALDDLIAALGQLPPSAEEVIAKLKSQVQYLVKECEKREHEISEREKATQIYTKQFEDLRQQTVDLNDLLTKEQGKWEEEKYELEKTSRELKEEVVALKAQTTELHTALDELASGKPDVDAKHVLRLAELRYNLEIAKSRTENQEDEISSLQQKLKDRLEELHKSLIQNKQFKQEWESEREILSQRVRRLESDLERSVPITTADSTTAQMAALTAKYRALLHDHSLLMKEKQGEVEGEVERKQLLEEREELREKLESAREKVHSLQSSLNLVGGKTTHVQVDVLSKQLAAVEMRELRERQKADHATNMHIGIKKERDELCRRLEEVKGAHDATIQMNQKLQTTETELRLSLQKAVPHEEYSRVTAQVTALEEEKGEILSEVRRLQTVLEVIETQIRLRQLVESIGEAEVEQLRRENRDLAALSNPRTTISRLHHEITTLKVKQMDTSAALEEGEAGRQRLEREVWGLRREVRQRDSLMDTLKQNTRARATRLHLIISELRQQYAGAVPLAQQERAVQALTTMYQERTTLQAALKSALHDKLESRLALRQLRVKQEALEDLKAALESPTAAQEHMTSWCNRVKELRLSNTELEEKLAALEETQSVCEARLESREQRVTQLQDQLSALERTWTDAQLAWDQREAELSQALQEYQDTQAKSVLDMATLNKDTPDTALPIATQLHNALDALQLRTTQLNHTVKQLEKCKGEIEEGTGKLREKEIEVIARDKIINELRSMGAVKDLPVPDLDTKARKLEDESVKVVIDGLKERLKLSQDTVAHYQDLLGKEHEKYLNLSTRSKEELARVTQEREDFLAKLRQAQAQLDGIPTLDPSTSLREDHVSQLQSLEEALQLSEGQLEESRNQVNGCERKIVQLERELAIAQRQFAEEKEQLEVSGQVRAQQHQREVDRLSGEVTKMRREREDLQGELNMLKEASGRTPSAILRTVVEKLRDQLIEKEKQVANLTTSVQEMKENMLREEEVNKEQIIEKEEATSLEPYRVEIEKLIADRDDLQRQLKQQSSSISEIKEQSSTDTQNFKEELRNYKLENINLKKQMLQKKNLSNTLKQKLDDFEGRSPEAIARAIESLKGKLEKINGTEEVRESENRRAKSQENIARWEERKKLNATIEKLKNRVKELESHKEVNERKLETSRELMRKMEREKSILREKVNAAGKAMTERLCRVCLKTLTSVDLEENQQSLPASPVSRTVSPAKSLSHTVTPKSQRPNRVSPSPERPAESTRLSGRVERRSSHDQDENEVKIRRQLKAALEEKHGLESRLQGAIEEIAALRNRLQEREEQEERRRAQESAMNRTGGSMSGMSGAALVLQYEKSIANLEEEVRQKARLLTHIKQVVRDAAGREEVLRREKDILVGKVTMLESVSEDTPAARLVQELRQAKLTITRLQRQLDHMNNSKT